MNKNKKKIVWLFKEKRKTRNEYSAAVTWWYGILENLGYEVVYHPYEEYDNDEFYQSIREYNPDFVFHVCYDKLHTEFIKLKDFTKVYVIQCDDDYRYDNYAKYWIPFIDGVISYPAKYETYKKDGLDENQFVKINWGFNPNTMMYGEKKTTDIFLSHGGGLHADRVDKINQFKIKGNMDVSIINDCLYEDLKDVWNKSKFSLTFTQNAMKTGQQVKGRVVEIPYFSVMASEYFPGLEEYYDLEKEIILFNSVEEAIDKINYFDKNDKEYNKILKAGRDRVWNTNTHYHSWNNVLHKIDEDYVKKDIGKLLKNKHG
tara:strand:- start:1158 stop:2105 length:948 start_codon:yes stop_codon:yes gene_type:complete